MSFAARPIGLVKGEFVFDDVIASDVTNYNLRARAVAAGWDQVIPLIATTTVNSGIVLSANSTNQYGYDTGTTFPAGSTLALVNNGFVIGMGGAGGDPQTAGSAGGPALRAQAALSVTNNGTIGGGGGGGGGGGYTNYYTGGGGRSGRTNSSAPVGAQKGTFTKGGNSSSGDVGGTTGAGANVLYAGAGGGGGWGARGGNGRSDYNNTVTGGAGGAAVVGNANITWVNTGTRYGAIT